jgi:hypothetical protein
MELASILAGERFSDRPKSVCPLIGAILRTFNDHIADDRRQDLYRFAAQAVGTRGDFALQRERAAVALDAAREARAETPRGKRLPEPEVDAGPEEIADYVVESMALRAYSRYRSRRWDDASHEKMISLLDRLIAIGGSAFDALLGELVEESAEAVEHGGGDPQVIFAELAEGGAEAGLEPGPALLDESPSPFGEGGEDHPPVLVGAGALHEAVVGERIEHLGDAGWTEVGGQGEFAGGHAIPVAQPEQQTVLSVAELPRPVALAPAHPAHRRHRALERSAQVLGAVALAALVYRSR